ncbi:DNA-3-methyladenine glycosylase 2 [Erwinia psidii]|uniref:DNA-3-methyladenine glycosylase 2 n=1 Tax=Erwinia psidii TaxID=69224 RepID=UPI00226B81FC|nr:DNA-3-methyladenine glycosylase 2 [Erwinia psidii]MCX8957177.1 DNA-3-methyladenine glycosylase 2 [Erwinia psidii]MCX8965423.1 DNA-3-methyladenine glycosylase 2 [Erwinia psidii]
MIDGKIAYRALTSRDSRFDGVFYVGVTSTGIYCRPVCPARSPREENCQFFASAEAAEKAAFRPCLRCRPELAPGNAPVDRSQRIASLLLQKIEQGLTEDSATLEEIAGQFSLSARQLRRIVQKELGVSPLELRQTRRLLLAKQLLTETSLSITDVAYASGFGSLRRFNDEFSTRYRLTPSRLRKDAGNLTADASQSSALLLSYRPPYDWAEMLDFLRRRALNGVEAVDDSRYSRTVCLGTHRGWVRVVQADKQHALKVEFSHSLTPVLPLLLRRLRNLFDLDAHPQLISSQLQQDPLLQQSLIAHPGLRVPGAFDGFEMVVRAVLGQQITVKAATTVGGRFVAAFGEPFSTPFPELTYLSPQAHHVATATIDDIASLGIISARARALLGLAQTCIRGTLPLEPVLDPENAITQLTAQPGIGEWTAHYIAMRALRWPDAFPKADVVIRKNLGGVSALQAEEISQSWRPWRSYAVMHIWKNLTPEKGE